MIIIKSKLFNLQKIVPRDDAFYKSFSNIQSWYFDAILNNNYSIVAQINIFYIGRSGILRTGIHIYKNAELVKSIREKYPYKSFEASKEIPLIKINGKQIMKGSINNETKQWTYVIHMGDHNAGFDLQLKNIVQGWKVKTYAGTWLVIPRLAVNGTIYIDGKKIPISGKGYHDNNVFPIYTPFKIKGWHFGTISLDSDVITWARVIKNRRKDKIIVVLNKRDNFICIPSDKVKFIIEKEFKNHKKMIPEIFSLKIDSSQLQANVKLKSINTHYIKMPTLNYWRYHLKTTGVIKTNDYTKKIDNIEISENMRFF